MYISKSQSVAAAFIIIGLFIASSIFLVSKDRKVPTSENKVRSIEVVSATPEPSPQTSEFILNDFHRVETEDGRKLWEVKAEKGQYFAKTNSAKVYDGTVWIFKQNNDVIKLQASEAELFLAGPTLDKVFASGKVVLNYREELMVETDVADFIRSENVVSSSKPVVITGKGIKITGTNFKADLNKQLFTLARDVSTTIQPRNP